MVDCRLRNNNKYSFEYLERMYKRYNKYYIRVGEKYYCIIADTKLSLNSIRVHKERIITRAEQLNQLMRGMLPAGIDVSVNEYSDIKLLSDKDKRMNDYRILEAIM